MRDSTLPADDDTQERHDQSDERLDFPIPDIIDSPVDDEEGIERGEEDDAVRRAAHRHRCGLFMSFNIILA